MKRTTTAKSDKKTKTTSKKGSTPKPTTKKSFLVVGLGASAGGVKALQEFFAMMPPNSGMAFVVVLHLSPEHESSLAQIIQTKTAMRVIQVNETHRVEPNHVYVIPPNRQLEMVDGTVRCTESVTHRGVRVAIDVFFRTLADAYERNAVCVVLSGTGADGTLGLKQIKERNGFAIVQDPKDAEYRDMPLNAIATNLADWVLPVRRMPENLIRFRDSSERLHLTEGDDGKVAREISADESLREIITLLKVRTGHDFSHYKTPTLIRRIARHLQIHGLEDIPSYLSYLRESPGEIQSLLKNLLINVTNFFRDKDAFGALEHDIVPQLFAGKSARDTVRVWSAGCASGEEPYSIAMLLTEYAERLNDPPQIQVFGTDVDEDAIAQAREHRYPATIEADLSVERLKKFFTKEGNFYRVKKELREKILFAPHNVLRDPPFSRLDLISCRNLMIYLNRETQERVLEIFHFALNSKGFLFLGSSETAEGVPNLYAPVDKKHRIYSRRIAPLGLILPPQMPLVGKWETTPKVRKQTLARAKSFSFGELHYQLLENIAPPSVLVNRDFEVQYMSESAGRFLQFRRGEPTNNLLKLVNPDLLPDLRAALFSVQREQKASRFENVRTVLDGEVILVNITARTVEFNDETSDYIFITFEQAVSSFAALTEGEEGKHARVFENDDRMEDFVRRLEEDLHRTKSQLRATIEQHEVSIEELRASNEELQAINEELRSTTEELETSKEEAQSVNEELTTVNAELKEKNDEATRTYSDLQNLMASTQIATMFLDRHLRIKLYTPPILDIFNFTSPDVGRPIVHFTNILEYEDLTKDIEQVLCTLTTIEREVRDKRDRTFLARILPYRTTDDRIEGVVVNFLDITERKRAELSKYFLASIVESSEDSIITIDFDRKITSWNKAAENLYGYSAAEAIGKPLTMLTLPKDLKEVLANIDKIKHSRTVEIFDSIRLNKDGREMNLEVVLSPVKDAAGEVIGVSTIARDVTERRKSEEALRESEERFRAMFEQANVGIVQITTDGKLLMPNQGFCNFIGYSVKETKRLNLQDITHPEDYEKEMELTGRLVNGRIPSYSLEKRYVRQDGKIVWGNMTATVVRSPADDPLYVVAIIEDITDRKNVENALNFQAHLLNTVEQSVVATDLEGKVTFWNRFAEEMFGWTAEEAVGRNILELNVPETELDRAEEIMSFLQRGKTWSGEFTVRRKDGSTFPAQVFDTPINDDKGNLIGIVGVSIDISERKRIEEALRKSEEHINLILESTKDYAIITYDITGRITRWNKGAEAIFGYTEEEAIGQMTHLIFTPEDLASKQPEKELANTLKYGRAEDERWHLRKDGTRFFASGVMQLLRNGETEGFVKIARDQTERLKAETAQRDKEMLAQFVATQEDERRRIARDIHDHLGQQLTTLRLKLDSVRKMCADEDEICNAVEDVKMIAEQLDRDIDFLAWELRPTSLDDLGLRVTLGNFAAEWSLYTGIKTNFHASRLMRKRLAYEIETNLYRIAQEALNNIHKHAKASNVSILLEKHNDTVSLIIEDDGVGFNPSNKRNRAKGIGLIGMRERAKICGGSLEIESAKGKGTTIFVRVPA